VAPVPSVGIREAGQAIDEPDRAPSRDPQPSRRRGGLLLPGVGRSVRRLRDDDPARRAQAGAARRAVQNPGRGTDGAGPEAPVRVGSTSAAASPTAREGTDRAGSASAGQAAADRVPRREHHVPGVGAPAGRPARGVDGGDSLSAGMHGVWAECGARGSRSGWTVRPSERLLRGARGRGGRRTRGARQVLVTSV